MGDASVWETSGGIRAAVEATMIEETLRKLEERLGGAEGLDETRKRELLALVNALKEEVRGLSQTHREEAGSIAGFAQLSAYEATRKRPDPALVGLSLEGLKRAVAAFETSHPRLVQTVNHISQILANLGI
ncbi:DUF4404 family protein [Limisphaera ngatamarikiensis]|uniref:DUF4404 family protein n=2 Tax=Limisphaera ngatamarikiensis TaxID=1324935 RepID=A0A6M1RJI5_9BACT|nr:DUF4404 family protein [Limisphaera ngatamarikiensis]